jgi:Zn ribbon nucleic-acid-binding protein
MSGNSYDSTCPNCGGSMDCYNDYKPHEYVSGECLECGFEYHTEDGQLTLEEVNQRRFDMGLEDIRVFKKRSTI